MVVAATSNISRSDMACMFCMLSAFMLCMPSSSSGIQLELSSATM